MIDKTKPLMPVTVTKTIIRFHKLCVDVIDAYDKETSK